MRSHIAVAAAAALLVACGGSEDEGPRGARSLAAAAQATSAQDAEGNHPPAIDDITLNPSQPVSESAIEAVVTTSDPDGDFVRVQYEWRVNGEVLEAGGRGAIQLPALSRGDKVEVIARASDGRLESEPQRARATVGNRPPVIQFLYITPNNKRIRRGDVLTAVPEAVDPENDRLDFSYAWTVNGAEAGEERTFDTKKLRRGDKVVLAVVASDGEAKSLPMQLPPIELVNSPPAIKEMPVLEHAGNTLRYQFEAEDPEGDHNLRFFLEDAPPGMEIDALSGVLTWTPDAGQAGKHKVQVGVKDSEGDASKFEWEVSVTPTAQPAPASPSE
jgi:hypothetical protein